MKNLLDVYIVILGLIAILFRKKLSRLTKASQVKVELSEKNSKFADSLMETSFLIGGIIFIIFGILAYFNLIKMKP